MYWGVTVRRCISCRRCFVFIFKGSKFKHLDLLKMKAVDFFEMSGLSDTNSYPKYLNKLL